MILLSYSRDNAEETAARLQLFESARVSSLRRLIEANFKREPGAPEGTLECDI